VPQLELEELIERSDQLTPIGEALEAAGERSGRLLLVTGPPGIGKTVLLGAAAELGYSSSATVRRALGTELERGNPFGVAKQLFDRDLKRARNGAGAAAVSALLRPEEDGGRRGSFQMLDDLYWHAQDLAQENPLFLIVDDLQWSDQPSAQFLSYLCRRLGDLPLTVLLAMRSGGPSEPALEDLARAATSRLQLAPLSLDGVGALVERTMGRSPSVDFVRACHAQTGGYPLYLQSLLEVALDRGVDPEGSSVAELEGIDAEGLLSHVWRRIDGLGPRAETVAGLVAVLGEHADTRRIAELCELEGATVADLIGGLANQGILDGAETPHFAHPVIRGAVEERLPAGRLDGWRRGAAHMLDREAADIRTISGHLIACLPAAEPWIVERLRRYADAALANGTPALAVSALKRALLEPPQAGEGVQVLRDLARAEDACGDWQGSLDHLDEALARSEDARERAAICTARGSTLTLLNRYDDALLAFEAGCKQLAGGRDPELEGRIEAERINIAFIANGFCEEDLQRLAAYGDDIPDGPLGMGILTARATVAAIRDHDLEEAAILAERALRIGGMRNSDSNSEIHSIALYMLTLANRPDLALELTEGELAHARREGHMRDIFILETGASTAALHCGDIPAAVSHAQNALAVAESGRHVSWGHATHAAGLLEVGDLAAVDRALAAADPLHWSFDVEGSTYLHLIRARLRIAQGRFDEAAVDAAEMRRRFEAYDAPLRGGDDNWRWIGAIVAHHQGERDLARSLISAELEKVRELGSLGYLGIILRTAALVGEPESELELLRESVDTLRFSNYRLEYARSLVELGAALRRRGERVAARDPLREGVDLAYRCGGGAVVSQGLAELKATGARPRRLVLDGPDALTPREARMAQLAANGHSNRQIAQELYVTLATVEGTLWRAYAKLGISGRGAREALPEALGPLFSPA
jgi:DNA-binding CsgD family transcriptional regulator/KaiC/GvpD/RAD55 family RecA-like ATPase